MSEKFVNEKRVCGTTLEGFGDYQTRWDDYEVRCHDCGKWTQDYGDISVQVGDDPEVQAWICPSCAEE